MKELKGVYMLEEKDKKKKKNKEETSILPGVGLDVGTSFLIASRKEKSGK